MTPQLRLLISIALFLLIGGVLAGNGMVGQYSSVVSGLMMGAAVGMMVAAWMGMRRNK